VKPSHYADKSYEDLKFLLAMYYRCAALRGNADAHYELGELYQKGGGVSRNQNEVLPGR
jgi:TPR repeat protein